MSIDAGTIKASAAGKAILAGEYVVLGDAPAIVAALNRRAKVSLSRTEQEFHSLTAPGYIAGTWRFLRSPDGRFEWRDKPPGAANFALLEEIWKQFPIDRSIRLTIELDSSDFFDPASGRKLGLGSSAAIATALTHAFCRFAGLPAVTDAYNIARDAHAKFQGGRGSGADVAASFFAGLIEYRRADRAAPKPLSWPAGLFCRYLWSGQPADTSAKIVRLQDGLKNSCSTKCNSSALATAANELTSLWSAGGSNDVAVILESFGRYVVALQQFDAEHDLGVFDAGHHKLVEMATNQGIIYKPCGAGGGDIGIVLANSRLSVDNFCQKATDDGFVVLDVELDSAAAKSWSEQIN